VGAVSDVNAEATLKCARCGTKRTMPLPNELPMCEVPLCGGVMVLVKVMKK
jgi:hypothetical protein